MNSQTLGDKRDFGSSRIRNDEASTSLVKGQPVILTLDGTEDGLAVVLPSTAGATKLNFGYGVVSDDTVATGALGNVQRMGICLYNILVRATRAASSDSWTSSQSIASAVLLTIETVNNGWATQASTRSIASTVNGTVTDFAQAMAFLAETVASMAASATATSDTRTVITQAVKAFLKML